MDMNTESHEIFDRFARFYDDDYRNYQDDIEVIAMLAAECGDPLLELGCGTGRVLVPLAAAGHTISGIDISRRLIAGAAHKLAQHGLGERATLVQADLRTFDLAYKDFSFAFCTSNTLMHFVSADEQLDVLRNAWRHLRPGGNLFIDLFNPDIARLLAINGLMEFADRWLDNTTGAEVQKWSVRTLDLAEQLQETLFIYEETFADGRGRRTNCPFTLRFLWRSEAELMLRLAGFVVADVWGDLDGSAYSTESEHLILLAQKPLSA